MKALNPAAEQGLPVPATAIESNIWRQAPLRFLGYCNEVGEAFRPIAPRFVPISYAIAFGYVGCDTLNNSMKVHKELETPRVVVVTEIDTLLWQTLASVLIPGQVIKLVTAGVNTTLHTPIAQQRLPPAVCRYGPTGVAFNVFFADSSVVFPFLVFF
jgi:hypothetical protein